MADETWAARDKRIADDARVEAKRQQRLDDAKAAKKDAWFPNRPVSPPRPPAGPRVDRHLELALNDVYELAGEPASWSHIPYAQAAAHPDSVAMSVTVRSEMAGIFDLFRRCGREPRTSQEADDQREVAWAWVIARHGWQEMFRANP